MIIPFPQPDKLTPFQQALLDALLEHYAFLDEEMEEPEESDAPEDPPE